MKKILLACATALLIPAPPTSAQTPQGAVTVTCENFDTQWTAARKAGQPKMRDGLKAALAAIAAGDAALGECMTKEFLKFYQLAGLESGAVANGHAPLIKDVRYNLTAVQALPPAQQCAAIRLFVDSWNRFRKKAPAVPEAVHGAMAREQAAKCKA